MPLAEVLVRLLAATIPMYVVGLKVHAYEMGLPVLVLVCLDLVLLMRGRFARGPLILLALWLTWCFFTAAARHPAASYSLSLLALTVVVLPLTVSWHEVDRKRLFLSFLAGLLVSFVVASYELGISLFGFTPLETLLPVGLLAESRTAEMLGLRRVKALMMEPAHYAIYLVFAYAIVDRWGISTLRSGTVALLKATIMVFLATTLSLSGILLLLVYLATRSLGVLAQLRWSRAGMVRTIALVLGLVGVASALANSGRMEAVALMTQRATLAVEVVRLGTLTGSEGSRANALPVLGRYWASNDRAGLFWGEGYANHEAWLSNEYGHLGERSSFARGEVNNVLAALGIATGMVGVALYILFCGKVAIRRGQGLPASIIAVWFVANLAYGMLIGYLIWSLVLMVSLLCRPPAWDLRTSTPG